jgi:hypothetical protein
MPDYVYLDSNVFWGMKHDAVHPDADFRTLIECLRPRYRFPFSEAHFLDVAVSDQPGNEANVIRDLTFLTEVTDGYALGLNHDPQMPPDYLNPSPGPLPEGGLPWIVIDRIPDVIALYRGMRREESWQPSFHVEGTSHKVDLQRLDRNHPMRPFLEHSDGTMSPAMIQSFLQHLSENISDPSVYKSFRQSAGTATKQIGKSDSLLASDTAMIERLAPLMALIAAETPKEMAKTLVKATNVICWLSRTNIDSLLWPDRLVRAYSLLDFNAGMRDKIDRKNLPSNMWRDSKHLFYAAGAKHLITEDNSFMKKARIVFSAFGVRTKVSSMSEFKNMSGSGKSV